MADHAIKRRALTKVRRQFLHKRPGEAEEEPQDNIVDIVNIVATPEQLTHNPVHTLEPSIALVEKGRTICAGGHFYSQTVKVSNVLIENQPQSQAVTLFLQNKDHESPPWEYCVKRLESYGNLELAMWAQRLKNYHQNYPKLLARYFENYKSEDFTRDRAKAILACRQLESRYSYHKVVLFSDRNNSTVPLSASYNEGMLREMGHNVESFVDWTKVNGLPLVFSGDSSLHLDICKSFLGNNLVQGDVFQQGPEYVTFLFDKDGNKRQVKIQLCLVKEPTENGFFRNGYVLIKDMNSSPNAIGLLEDDHNKKENVKEDQNNQKQVKKEEEESVNDSCETADTGGLHHDELSPSESDDL